MKRPSLILILLPLLLLLVSANKAKPHYRHILGHTYAKINDSLYAGIYEVDQREYKQFLATLDSKAYELCKIDSSQWVKKFPVSYNDPMEKNYHKHPAFDLYPVVNISWYAANKYCQWLTDKYGREINKDVFVFRLPTETEWNLAAHADPLTKLPPNLLNGKHLAGNHKQIGPSQRPHTDSAYLQNVGYIRGDTLNLWQDGGFYTVRKDAYWPNDLGLYNTIGNVAEMTNTEGVQKGGSWLDTLSNCGVDKVQRYAEPDPRVGFRVFVDKVRTKH